MFLIKENSLSDIARCTSNWHVRTENDRPKHSVYLENFNALCAYKTFRLLTEELVWPKMCLAI